MAIDSTRVDQALIDEFLDEYDEHMELIHRAVPAMDRDPGSQEHLHQLFRVVHSIKSNLLMMELHSLAELMHVFETTLASIRAGERRYHPGLSDVLLLLVDDIRGYAAETLTGKDVEASVQIIRPVIGRISHAADEDMAGTVRECLQILDPGGNYNVETEDQPIEAYAVTTPPGTTDQSFFKDLITRVESYIPNWRGRSQRILEMTLAINQAAGNAVDVRQLTTAVYLHDIGMSFLPMDIIAKKTGLSDQEFAILRSHSLLGYEWLRRIPGWEPAAQMVLQHHERPDGRGYPAGLTAPDLCAGAQIIALADTYEAMINNRSYRDNKRPVMRAILEINSQAKQQFDEVWVEHFNEVMRARTKK